MQRTLSLVDTTSYKLALQGELNGTFRATRLDFSGGGFAASVPITPPLELPALALRDEVDALRLRLDEGLPPWDREVTHQLTFMDVSLAGTVHLRVCADLKSTEPLLTLRLTVKALLGSHATRPTFALTFARPADLTKPDVLLVPSLEVRDLCLPLPRIPAYRGVLDFPPGELDLKPVPLHLSWSKIEVRLTVPGTPAARLSILVAGLTLRSTAAPGQRLSGELRLVLDAQGLVRGQSYFDRDEPTPESRLRLLLETWAYEQAGKVRRLILGWVDPDVGRLLGQFASDLVERGERVAEQVRRKLPSHVRVALAVETRDDVPVRVKQLRFDWWSPEKKGPDDKPLALRRRIDLPGLQLDAPCDVVEDSAGQALTFTLVVDAVDEKVRLALLQTLPATGAALHLSSTFALASRSPTQTHRSLHGDDTRSADAPPLFTLKVARLPAATPATLLLCELHGGELKVLRQLERPLSTQPGAPVDLALADLRSAEWKLEFDMNVDLAGTLGRFVLPFLRLKDAAKDIEQLIEITDASFGEWRGGRAIGGEATVTLKLGRGLALSSKIAMNFDLDRFAIVPRADQLVLSSAEPALTRALFGLTWRFKPAPRRGSSTTNDYLVLTTKNDDYQLRLADGASLELSFSELGKSPLRFKVTRFAVTGSGIDLDATVENDPIQLNGIDTKFRFTSGTLSIRANRISGFTLAGEGTLPPKLIGEATARVWLQLGERDGSLALLAASAELKTKEPLRCDQTHFSFSLSAIGLKFVRDGGREHLYFTLTGTARLSPTGNLLADHPVEGLKAITIDLVEAPLAGDARVLAKHIKFLIELPKKLKFSFLRVFEMELRAIGFLPQVEFFNDGPAMFLTGQVKFAVSGGDVIDARMDFHGLYLGLPEPGKVLPRVHFKGLAVQVAVGGAFKLAGAVDFYDEPARRGFDGEGQLTLPGLPTIAVSFAFLTVREDADHPWRRAWFVYAQLGKMSVLLPIIQIYLREVGLGFGYRYTLVSIKEVDREPDPKKLIKALTDLSRRQGDLARRAAWEVDLEPDGQDPRWTIVMRALFTQQSAAATPLQWNELAERDIDNTFLFDVVMALRSDLTFFLSARAWINTNYHEFLAGGTDVSEHPLLSGFAVLSPRHRRFLAHVASHKGAYIGKHPELPAFLKDALRDSEFSATFLLQPGLLHYELGWPNMLRWRAKLGPLEASFQGGQLFRISDHHLVIGTSFIAAGSLDLAGELSLGFVGVRVSAHVDVAYGARWIGVLDFTKPLEGTALYGAASIAMRATFSVQAWLRLKLGFFKLELNFSFSFSLSLTACVEVGVIGLAPGLSGRAALCLSIAGHQLHIGIDVAANRGAVERARERTAGFLNVGLTATEVERLPGMDAPQPVDDGRKKGLRVRPGKVGARRELAPLRRRKPAWPFLQRRRTLFQAITAPEYTAIVVKRSESTPDELAVVLLIPAGHEHGFLAPPPRVGVNVVSDYELTLPPIAEGEADVEYELFDPIQWKPRTCAPGTTASWRVRWEAKIKGERVEGPTEQRQESELTLRDYLEGAFRRVGPDDAYDLEDPIGFQSTIDEPTLDPRVIDGGEDAHEPALRAAEEQLLSSPNFKRDERLPFDRDLREAYTNSIYLPDPAKSAVGLTDDDAEVGLELQQTLQLRGLILRGLIEDARAFADMPPDRSSFIEELGGQTHRFHALHLGLLVRVKVKERAPDAEPARPGGGKPPGAPLRLPEWLVNETADARPEIRQRTSNVQTAPEAGPEKPVTTFNTRDRSFKLRPLVYRHDRAFADARTITLAWDMAWNDSGTASAAPPEARSKAAAVRRDPVQHLDHYRVTRRTLGHQEPERVMKVQPADVLNLKRGFGRLQRLRRFQYVDQFDDLGDAEQSGLPPEGRTYLYTVTPVDLAGDAAPSSLTFRATRYPDAPPLPPLDAVLEVRFPTAAGAAASGEPLVRPETVVLRWTRPSTARRSTTYRLAFRREPAVGLGSYGLDPGARPAGAAANQSQPLTTDTFVELGTPDSSLELSIDPKALVRAGVLPPPGPLRAPFTPQAWSVFVQAQRTREKEAVVVVRSSLVPVALELVFPTQDPATKPARRRPGTLEWPLRPERRPPLLLPPEDETADVADAHVPMPDPAPGAWSGLPMYRRHPDDLRCVQLRWNRGASGLRRDPRASPDLVAAYDLFELDLDALSTEAQSSGAALEAAARHAQRMEMVPPEDLRLIPGDTLAPNEWEAWYPSAVQRIRPPADPDVQDTSSRPWFSWRDSFLRWPAWPGVTDDQLGQGAPDEVPLMVLQGLPDGVWRAVDVELQDGPDVGWLKVHTDGLGVVVEARRDDPNDRSPPRALQITPPTTEALSTGAFTSAARRLLEGRIACVGAVGAKCLITIRGITGDTELRCEVRPRRRRPLHPALEAIIERASRHVDDPPDRKRYECHVQGLPPMQPIDLSGLMAALPPRTDPYGWGLLQRLGLAATFSLHVADRGGLVPPDDLVAQVRKAVEAAVLVDEAPWAAVKEHLHVELLIQRGRAVTREEGAFSEAGLLGMVQVSLRPVSHPLFAYGRVDITGHAGQEITLAFDAATAPLTVLDVSRVRGQAGDEASAPPIEVELLPSGDAARLFTTRLPASGRATLLVRYGRRFTDEPSRLPLPPRVGWVLDRESTHLPELDDFAEYDATTCAPRVVLWPRQRWTTAAALAALQATIARPSVSVSRRVEVAVGAGTVSFEVALHGALPDGAEVELELRAPRHEQPRTLRLTRPGVVPVAVTCAKPLALGDTVELIIDAARLVSAPKPAEVDRINERGVAEAVILVGSRSAGPPAPPPPAVPTFGLPPSATSTEAWTGLDPLPAFPAWTGDDDLPTRPTELFTAAPSWPEWCTRVPTGWLSNLRAVDDGADPKGHWERLDRLLRSIDPSVDSPTLRLPEGAATGAVFSAIASWTQRFHDHGPVPRSQPVSGQPLPGPWSATAYPRQGTPAIAVPDAAGRLTYAHLLEDRWAHARRYHITLIDRYDALWRGLEDWSSLVPESGVLPSAQVLAQRGGLDVAIERRNPVVTPTILSCARLDGPTALGHEAPPGPTWEVIIAKHHEEALSERNVTLQRKLDFRQVAFTLLRRLADERWPRHLVKLLATAHPGSIRIAPTPTSPRVGVPALPGPDPLAGPIDDAAYARLGPDEARAVALPARLPSFQQGALVLQWRALPYYYEHHLLAIAQAARRVSSVNRVVQRDFEYCAPSPLLGVSAVDARIAGVDLRVFQFDLQLASYWDCLPESARAAWPDEAPPTSFGPDGERVVLQSALPDPEVVYELALRRAGSREVQAELFVDTTDASAPRFAARQLARGLLVHVTGPGFPAAKEARDADGNLLPARIRLGGALLPVRRATLQRPVDALRRRLELAGETWALPASVLARGGLVDAELECAGGLLAAERAQLEQDLFEESYLHGRLDPPVASRARPAGRVVSEDAVLPALRTVDVVRARPVFLRRTAAPLPAATVDAIRSLAAPGTALRARLDRFVAPMEAKDGWAVIAVWTSVRPQDVPASLAQILTVSATAVEWQFSPAGQRYHELEALAASLPDGPAARDLRTLMAALGRTVETDLRQGDLPAGAASFDEVLGTTGCFDADHDWVRAPGVDCPSLQELQARTDAAFAPGAAAHWKLTALWTKLRRVGVALTAPAPAPVSGLIVSSRLLCPRGPVADDDLAALEKALDEGTPERLRQDGLDLAALRGLEASVDAEVVVAGTPGRLPPGVLVRPAPYLALRWRSQAAPPLDRLRAIAADDDLALQDGLADLARKRRAEKGEVVEVRVAPTADHLPAALAALFDRTDPHAWRLRTLPFDAHRAAFDLWAGSPGVASAPDLAAVRAFVMSPPRELSVPLSPDRPTPALLRLLGLAARLHLRREGLLWLRDVNGDMTPPSVTEEAGLKALQAGYPGEVERAASAILEGACDASITPFALSPMAPTVPRALTGLVSTDGHELRFARWPSDPGELSEALDVAGDELRPRLVALVEHALEVAPTFRSGAPPRPEAAPADLPDLELARTSLVATRPMTPEELSMLVDGIPEGRRAPFERLYRLSLAAGLQDAGPLGGAASGAGDGLVVRARRGSARPSVDSSPEWHVPRSTP